MKNILSGQSFNGKMSEEELVVRKKEAEEHYGNFLLALGYDLDNDPNMRGSAFRVVKMYTQETAKGTYLPSPKLTVFPNEGDQKYTGVVFQGGIEIKSLCSHHLMPFIGKCHLAYIPKDKVLGLSKLNRLVDWFARRPQLQEHLTTQIHSFLSELVETDDVAVYIEASHTCVALRGVEQASTMRTSKLTGSFMTEDSCRSEFYHMVNREEKI